MGKASCPIKGPEWDKIKSRINLNNDELTYVYDYLGERYPSGREVAKLRKGEPLSPTNSQRVWDIEKEEKLTQGRIGIVTKDKYGLEETVFTERRTQWKEPTEVFPLINKLMAKYGSEFEFKHQISHTPIFGNKGGNEVFEIIVKDTKVAARQSHPESLTLKNNPYFTAKSIQINEGNEYVVNGEVYPSMEDAINANMKQISQLPEGKEKFDRIERVSSLVLNKLTIKSRPFELYGSNEAKARQAVFQNNFVLSRINDLISNILGLKDNNFDNNLTREQFIDKINSIVKNNDLRNIIQEELQKIEEWQYTPQRDYRTEKNTLLEYLKRGKESLEEFSTNQQTLIRKELPSLFKENKFKSYNQAVQFYTNHVNKKYNKLIVVDNKSREITNFKRKALINKYQTLLDFFDLVPDYKDRITNKIISEYDRLLKFSNKEEYTTGKKLRAAVHNAGQMLGEDMFLSSKEDSNNKYFKVNWVDKLLRTTGIKKDNVVAITSLHTLADALANTKSEYQELAKHLLPYIKGRKDIEVRFLNSPEIPNTEGNYHADVDTNHETGSSKITHEHISIAIGGVIFNKSPERLLLHEIVHSLTTVYTSSYSYEQSIKGKPDMFREYMSYLEKYVKENALYDYNSMLGDKPYGLANPEEFMSEIMTNRSFQELLKNIPPMEEKKFKNLFEELLDIIAKIFGIKRYNNAYEQLIDVVEAVISQQSKFDLYGESKPDELTPIFQRGDKIIANQDQRIATAPVKEGYTRLYRSEDDKSDLKKGPSWLADMPEIKEQIEAQGRWFYKTLTEAEEHAKRFGSSGITYVDVKTEEVEKHNARNNKFAGGYGKEGNEYFVSKEIASNRKPFFKGQSSSRQKEFDIELYNKIKDRLLKTFPQVTNIVEDPELPVTARLMPGGTEIRINPNLVAKDTIGHEFGHILIDLIGGMSNPLVKSGRDQLRGTKVEAEVIELYPDLVQLNDERLDKEIVTRSLGREVTEMFEEEESRSKFENFVIRFFRRVRVMLGIEKSAVKQLASIMLKGQPLATKETATPRERKAGLFVSDSAANYSQDSRDKREDGAIIRDFILKENEIRDAVVDAIGKKINIYSKRAKTPQQEKAIETLKILHRNLQQTSPTSSMLLFIRNAIEATSDINTRYIAAKRKRAKGDSKAFTPQMLDEWRTYLATYDILELYRDLLKSTKDEVDIFKTDKDLKALKLLLGEERSSLNVLLGKIKNITIEGNSNIIDAVLPILDKVIADKEYLKSLYSTEGKQLTVDFLVPYVTVVEAEYKEKAWKDYAALKPEDKENKTRDQYVVDYISDRRDEIMEKTRKLISDELERGNDDVATILKHVDTILDSKDVVASALAKAWVIHKQAAQIDITEARYDFIDRIRALAKQTGRSLTAGEEEFFSFMIEKDPSKKNVKTQYIVSATHSKLREDWADILEITSSYNFRVGSDNHLASDKEKFDFRQQWLDNNAPEDKEARLKAEHDFMLELLKGKRITQEQMKGWLKNQTKSTYGNRKFEEGLFEGSEEALQELRAWRSKNFWTFREPAKMYKDLNGQWYDLERIRAAGLKEGKQTDERILFYDFIVDYLEKADRLLPYGKRLGYRLPGMPKNFEERLRSGENIGKAAASALDFGIRKKASDVDKGELSESGKTELVNEAKEIIHLIPTYYLNKIDEKDQLYDIGSLYFNFFKMAREYRSTADILPDLEMTRYFVNNRDVTRRDFRGRPLKDSLSADKEAVLTKSGHNSNIAAMVNDFFNFEIYGKRKAEEADWNILGLEIDQAKFLDGINKYTSLSLLGLNLVAGTANVILGETMQRIEALAGEHFKPHNMRNASKTYYKHLGGMLADVADQRPTNLISLLNDRFDTLNDYSGGRLRNSKFKELMTTNTLFFISHTGEHYMQTRAMLALLDTIEVKDKDGKVIGTMLEMYKVNKETNKIEIDERARDFWTADKEALFKTKLKRILSRIHGEYSHEGMSAMQQYALGRMGLLFRKFVVPGFKRRWQGKQYNELSETYTEGNYITFGRFFGKMVKDLVTLKFELLSKNSPLTPMEVANIKRTLGEISALLGIVVLSGFAMKLKDEDPEHERLWSFLAYQTFRLRSELAFFFMPTEAMKILRSPMASMSFLESLIKLTGQLSDPFLSGTFTFDVYERGAWKGQPKIYKTLTDMTPGWKQYYRVRDISDQLNWFQQSSVQFK